MHLNTFYLFFLFSSSRSHSFCSSCACDGELADELVLADDELADELAVELELDDDEQAELDDELE